MRILNAFRKTMLKKSKFSQYLVYALGEIILVVIGILIALWVNRSNESQKLEKSTVLTAKMVLKQIQKDVVSIEETLMEWNEERKVTDTILRLTKKDEAISKSCLSCSDLLLGVSFPTITNRIPNTITGKELYTGEVSKLLEEIEHHYLEGLKMTAFHENEVINFSTNTMKYWKDNFDWFSDIFGRGKCDAGCQDYFRNSSDYRNKVTYYEMILLDSYYFQLEEFKMRNQKYIEQLEALL